jgi:hypothetical protein
MFYGANFQVHFITQVVGQFDNGVKSRFWPVKKKRFREPKVYFSNKPDKQYTVKTPYVIWIDFCSKIFLKESAYLKNDFPYT